MAFLGREVKNQLLSGENTHKVLLLGNQWNKKRKRKLWKWLVVAVALIFFAFMAILPFAWEDGDDGAGAQSHDRKLINTKISCLIWFGTSLFRDSESTISYV